MPAIHAICTQLKVALELLKEEAGATPLSYPGNTPAAKAYFHLSALYAALLMADKRDED